MVCNRRVVRITLPVAAGAKRRTLPRSGMQGRSNAVLIPFRPLRIRPGAYSWSGTGWGGGGPAYRAFGRMRRLSAACSMMWAVQPIDRLETKVGVNISLGTPTWSMTTPA